MKKYLSFLIIMTLVWARPVLVEAQNKTSEEAQPVDVTSINKNINDIEKDLQTSSQAQNGAAGAYSLPSAQDKVNSFEKSDPESARPEDINDLNRKVQPEINQNFEAMKGVPTPADNDYNVHLKDMQQPPTSDQILDMVIPAASQDKSMDLEFDEINLDSILHTIGNVANINIILDPALKAKTLALHVKNVKIHEALSIMAESYNLAFKKIGSSLFVTTKDRIHGDNVTAQLIKLRYVKADDVKEMAHNLVNSINISEQNNSIMVVGTPEEIGKIVDMVKKMDVSQPQVILEAKIIEINKNAMKNLGVTWSPTISTSYQETGRPVSFDNVQNSVGSAFKIYSIARNPLQFNATLDMLESDNLAKTLSNPRIITMNNQEAEIFVGDKIPYTVTTISNGVATNDVRFVEPGIRLKITPSIIDKDFVVVKIEPEVSYIYSFIGPQNQYPWVKSRNATAYVRIQNNQPFVLGGLLDKQDQKTTTKVPILGNLPMLGKLFSSQSHTVTDSELIIVVVPVIVNQ